MITKFSFPTAIHFGAGARKLVAEHLKQQGLKRPLIVTDRGLGVLPILHDFAESLDGLDVKVYAGVFGNPVKKQVDDGANAYREHRADCVIGFGGGAALDVDGPHDPQAAQPATREYSARLLKIGRSSPELLLAHAYVRYMGDLSGGPMLKASVAKMLGIGAEDGGLSFFAFPHIADPVAFNRAFRDALDAAAFVAPSPEAIVREAQYGFALHERMFRELQ